MTRDEGKARPAPGQTYRSTKERPEYLDRVSDGKRLGTEYVGIADVEWKMLVDVAFDIYWKARRLLRPLTPEEKANLLNLIRTDRRISHPLTIGVLPDGQRFLADGHHRLDIWLKEREHGWLKPVFQEQPFESWEHAKKWIRDNQRGRRDHDRTWSKYCLGQEYNEQKAQGTRTDLTSPKMGRSSKLSPRGSVVKTASATAPSNAVARSAKPLIRSVRSRSLAVH